MEMQSDFTSMERAVMEGKNFLDSRLGRGWRSRIRWSAINMSSSRCILGQLYGSFWEGRRALGLKTEEAIALGFDAQDYEDYPRLAKIWRRTQRA